MSNVHAVLSADDRLTPAFRAASSEALKFGAAVGVAGKLADKALSAISAATIGGIKSAIAEADGLYDLSQQVGVGVKQLAAYKLAAEQTGTSLSAIGQGIKGLSLAQSRFGEALRAAGVTAASTDGQLRQLADLFSAMPDGLDKAALAVKLFGRAGMDLIPFLNLGRRGLDEAAAASDRYAAAMASLAPQADRLNDLQAELAVSGQALYANMALALMPALTKTATEMAVVARESGVLSAAMHGLATLPQHFVELGDAAADSAAKFNPVQETMRALVVLGGNVAFVFRAIGTEIGGMAAQIEALARADFRGFFAIGAAMKEDAEKARAEFDAWEQRMLGRGQREPTPGDRISDPDSREETERARRVAARRGRAEALARAVLDKQENEKAKRAAERAERERLQVLKEGYSARMEAIRDGLGAEQQELRLAQERELIDEETYLRRSHELREAAIRARAQLLAEQYQTTSDPSERARLLKEMQSLAGEARQAFGDLELGLAKLEMQATKTLKAMSAEAWDEALKFGADNEALREEIATLGLSAEQLTAYKLAKIEAQRASALLDAAEFEKYAQALEDEGLAAAATVEGYRELAKARRAAAAAMGDTLTLLPAAEAKREWTNLVTEFKSDLRQGLTDSLFRSFESGKRFGRSFVESLRNYLKTAALKVVVRAIVEPIVGAAGAMLSPAAMAGQAGGIAGGGAGGGGMSVLGMAGNAWSLLTGGLSAGIGSSVASGVLAFADKMSFSGIPGVEGLGDALAGVSQQIGTLAGTLGNVAAGFALYKGISGQYRTNAFTDVAVAVGSAFLGPIAGVIGGLFNRAFGRKPKEVTDYGIEGTFSGIDFTGQSFEKWKQEGGWFRSDKSGTNRDPLAAELDAELDKAFAQMKLQVGGFAEALGLDSAAIAGFSKSVSLSFKGLDEEGRKTAIADLFIGLGNDMASLALAGSDFAKEGEGALDTLGRLATSLIGVNAIFDQMGRRLLSISLAGGDAASQLLDLAGGLESFSGLTSNYLQAIYTPEEQADLIRKQLVGAFDGLDVEMPTTRAGFRALVDSLDLTTESGRKLYVSLLALAPVFGQVVDASEAAAADAVRRAADIAAGRRSWHDRLDVVTGRRTQRDVDLANDLAATDDQETQALIRRTYAAEDARDRADEASESLRAMASEAASAAEAWRQAWAGLADSIRGTIRELRGEALGGGARGFAAVQADFATASAQARAGDQGAAGRLPDLARQVVELAKGQAGSDAEYRLLVARTLGSLSATLDGLRRAGVPIPAFASGGLHAGGLRLVGERGPEIEVTGPARLWNAEQTRAMLGGDDSARALAAVVRAIERGTADNSAENVAMVRLLGKLASMLNGVTNGAATLRTEVVA